MDFGAAFAPVTLHVDVCFGRRIVFEQHRRVADRWQLRGKRIQLGAHFGKLQRLAVFLPVEVAAGAEEYIQHRVLLHLAALGGIEEEDLAGVIHGVRDLAISEIPIVVDAGVEHGLAQFRFVIRQVLGNLVLFQQRLALAVVRRTGREVRAEFPR